MTKDELKEKLRKELPTAYYLDACILLDQFIRIYDYKRRHDNTGGFWKRLFYKSVIYSMLVDGYIRDVRVNSTTGKYLFGLYAKHGKPLTNTLKKVKAGGGAGITPERYQLAWDICEVLNEHDPEHC